MDKYLLSFFYVLGGFPAGSSGKDCLINALDLRDVGSVPELGRFPEEGHGNPFQYSCRENPTESGALGL